MKYYTYTWAVVFIVITMIGYQAWAQTLPGPADVSRIEPKFEPSLTDRSVSSPLIPQIRTSSEVPAAAYGMSITIENIVLDGITAFKASDLQSLYTDYLNQEIPLAAVWGIAEKITRHYRKEGYFLSRAYVPAQEISGGTIQINVLEGFVGDVLLDESTEEHSLINLMIEQLKASRPIKTQVLESFMLRINDLPGVEYRAVVQPLADGTEGGVSIALEKQEESGVLTATLDNYGSRFLGPYQATVTYQDSFIPLQQTTLSALTSLPTDELRYGALRQRIPIAPDWDIELSGSYVISAPGASLEVNNIESSSINLGVSLGWQPIRQRQENLSLSLSLDGQNTNGDILDNNPLTRDRIRTVSLRVDYDTNDSWSGYNYLSAIATKGLDVFGSSDDGDLNLSRADADPDFSTLQASYTRLQPIDSDWLAVGRLSGQVASAPLFSVQEFGYGGNGFGRAYDSSEITGDHGLAGSVEMRYRALNIWPELRTVPYAFYDIGRIWNKDAGSKPESASSAGLGVRLNHKTGLSGNLGFAWPFTKDIDTPIYGQGNGPRIIIQLGYGF